MLNYQARIIAVTILLIVAPACSSALSGERLAPKQTASPAETQRIAPMATHRTERQAATAHESRSPFPVLPLLVHYEYVPHYFVQWLSDHPQYARIEAAVTDSEPPVFNLTLTEKGSRRRVNYCNSEARLKEMAQAGLDVRLTKIDHRATNNFGQAPMREFGFTDERGQAVRWRFTLASPVSERGAGLTPQEEGAGLSLIYRELGTAAGAGTAAQIGDKVSEAEPWTEISSPPYFVAYRGAYSDGIGIGAIRPGQESWRVTVPPKDLNEGAQWALADDQGRTRQLRIASKRGDEFTIQETGQSLTLQARRTSTGFALRSITLTSLSKTMRIGFAPELDLADGPATPVNFQIDQNGRNKIAHGVVSVEKRGAAASLRWVFKAPDWARSRVLNSTVTVNDNGYKVEMR
ncbi:MAG TPA: hypothetical protein VJ810_14700 [Blastocatellia bacterium]|nr:hypothetical protein [Blastocatellia bacterium]